MKQYRYFALTEGKNPQEPTGLLRELETDSEYFLEYLDEDGQWVLDFELATYIFGESPNSVQVNDAAAREIARKIAPAKKFHLLKAYHGDHDQEDHGNWADGKGGDWKETLDSGTPEEIKAALAEATRPADRHREFYGSILDNVYIMPGGEIVEYDGDAYASIVEGSEFVANADVDSAIEAIQEKENKDFWESPVPLYHATRDENAEDILRDGLEARNQTRGLANRGTGSAVFTSLNPDAIAESYGPTVIEIDTAAMKRDGLTPFSFRETPIVEAEAREGLAHVLGIEDFYQDIEAGLDPDTIIINGAIPAKYLKRVDHKAERSRWRKYHGDHDQSTHGNWAKGVSSDDPHHWSQENATDSPEFKRWREQNPDTHEILFAESPDWAEWAARIKSERSAERLGMMQEAAGKIGLPEGVKLEYVDEPGPAFEVGDEKWTTGAHYDPQADTIRFFTGEFTRPDLLGAGMSHEISHARYQRMRAAIGDETRHMHEVLTLEDRQKLRDPDTYKLNAEGRFRYPATAVFEMLYNENHKDFREQLIREDGVSPYSISYWKHYEAVRDKGMPDARNTKQYAAFDRAVDETLAEVNRAKWEGNWTYANKSWDQLDGLLKLVGKNTRKAPFNPA